MDVDKSTLVILWPSLQTSLKSDSVASQGDSGVIEIIYT